MKEAILSREFELDDSIDNGVQPLTDTIIEPDITTLSTGVSDSFDLPPPPPTILQTEHNSHDDELLLPPPLLPTEFTLSNELAHVDVHLSNSDEDKQNSSLTTTHVNKIPLRDTEDHSIIASGEIKSVKERKAIKNKPSLASNKGKKNVTTKHQATIVSAFDMFKRKLSPDKEADTTKDNVKASRSDDSIS